MTKLILIRHGQTNYNLENRYCGFSDPPLNDRGVWQANKFVDRLKDLKIDKVYSSDLRRAYETAEIIFKNSSINPDFAIAKSARRADRLNPIGFNLARRGNPKQISNEKFGINKIEEFREMNFGIFEGLKYKDIIKKHPKLYKNWINNPVKVKIPNGEGLKDLTQRVKEKLFFILSRHEGKTLAVVTHSGPIRIILCEALKFDLKMFWKIEQENAALNIVDYFNESLPIVVKMNDTFHLSTPEGLIL